MENPDRLSAVRAKMREDGVGVLLIKATDRYFNEYVPTRKNQRAWLTGFTGSAGDVLVTQKRAVLFVDGRYTLQAAQQAPDFEVEVAPLGTSIQHQWLQAIAAFKDLSDPSIYVDTQLVSRRVLEHIEKAAHGAGLKVIGKAASYLIGLGYDEQEHGSPSVLREISEALCGQSVNDKFEQIQQFLTEHGLDALLVSPLDEIAWLCNLRGTDFKHQATFAARALVFRDKIVVGLENFAEQKAPAGIELVAEKDMWRQLDDRSGKKQFVLGVDELRTPENVIAELEVVAELRFIDSPIKQLKAIKNPRELQHMRSSFALADRVVFQVQTWLCQQVSSGAHITEVQVGEYLKNTFLESGAVELSFSPICAAGKNAAVIHYGTLDPRAAIKKGDLFLLDVGGIYEGGYSTDLTRTFLVGDEHTVANEQQKHLFTTVLKGSIAGLSAKLPRTATGQQLDALVRAPIWRAGYDYAHGTGHGVGINVHEAPPTVAIGSSTTFAVGQVFSIEPGIYFPEFGGIRIENLATIVDDPEHGNYVRVLPLTFAPFDSRLIDDRQLTVQEKEFLAYYSEGFEWNSAHMPKLLT